MEWTPSQAVAEDTGRAVPGGGVPVAGGGHIGGWDPQARRNPVVADSVEVEGGFLPMPDPAVGGTRGRSAFDKPPRAPSCAALECENDSGGRFTLRPSGDSHGGGPASFASATPCGQAARPPVAERAAGAVAGATRLAEGSVRRRAERVFTPSPPRLDGSLQHQKSLREGGRAPLRGGGAPVGRRTGRRAVRHRRARPGRARRGSPWPSRTGPLDWEGPRSGGEDGDAHLQPPRCRSRHAGMGGPSHPRPRSADRHRRSAGRGATASRPATWVIGGAHPTTRFPCTGTPTWDVHARIGIGRVEIRLRIMAFRSNIDKLRDGGRTHRARPGFPAGFHRFEPSVWRRRLLSASFPLRRSCGPSPRGIE